MDNFTLKNINKLLIPLAMYFGVFFLAFVYCPPGDPTLNLTYHGIAHWLITPLFSSFYGFYSYKLLKKILLPQFFYFFLMLSFGNWLSIPERPENCCLIPDTSLVIYSMIPSIISAVITMFIIKLIVAKKHKREQNPETINDNITK